MSQRIRTLVRVEGIVQGVGFRPFVYSLATGLGLGGLVGNDLHGVFAEVEGSSEAIEEFLAALLRDAPPLASIERITTKSLQPNGSSSFSIAPSESGDVRKALVSADSATCADCLAELRDPGDRRFGYPFINCTNCGPRFTIIRDVPYDRPLTTMSSFAMCELCAVEYHDPTNRRFHAQPVCCPACGPSLRLIDHTGAPLAASPLPGPTPPSPTPPSPALPGPPPPSPTLHSPTPPGPPPPSPTPPSPPIAAAAALLLRGELLAVKGLGGYHLAADAASDEATAALRARKHREDKPFAVMAADLAQARLLCEVDEAAAALLTSRRRPIVLLPVRPDAALARSVAPANRQLGVMLPYTPLHHLLLGEVGRPIVLTSGNISDEPIAHTDDEALERLRGIADAFLAHDRAIHIRTDDSVVRAFGGRESVIRRSRGYAPEPVTVRTGFRRHVLACGAELKNTFCLARDDHAFVSQHIGDLENAATLRSFTEGIDHFSRLFDIQPAAVAHDLHPEYLSTKYAEDLAAAADDCLELVGVQHHHAHIASCLADNGADGPVIGVAFDGTGYGTDGTIWGGEFLIADLAGFQRAAYLAPVPMPGGTAAIRQPWRMAAAYLDAAYPGGTPGTLDVTRRNERHWADVLTMARRGINAPLTSSAGRLFDAVAAVLGVRDSINYEGQAAVELEQLADPAERSSYRAAIVPVGQDQPDGPTSDTPPSTPAGPQPTSDTPPSTPAGPQPTGLTPPSTPAGPQPTGLTPPSTPAGPQPTGLTPPSTPAGPQPTGLTPPSTPAGPQPTGLTPPSTPAGPQPTGLTPPSTPAGPQPTGLTPPSTPAGPRPADGGAQLLVAGSDLVRAVADDLAAGVDRSVIAARFHNGVATLIADCCLALRERHGLNTVALSGGVFQNLLLTHGVVGRLEAHGFDVLLHSQVPCNDGGISLGQAVAAAARDWQR